ncbi:hypothetical protein PHISP_08541, partial [Aspergillus sp. HF37]
HCLELWKNTAHGTRPGTIADIWAEERAALMPLPVAFDGFIELSKRVSPTCLISFERNRYSVPKSFANRPISLRIYPARLVVAAEGNILCEHPRVIQRSQTPALLKGLIFRPDDAAVSPSHTRKGGRLYRYYISQTVLKHGAGACLSGA